MNGKEIQIIKYIQLQIKIAIRDQGLTQIEVAEKSGLFRSQVQRLLSPQAGLDYDYTFKTLLKIGLALDLISLDFDENQIVNLRLKYQKNN